jgi:hypothetical protein
MSLSPSGHTVFVSPIKEFYNLKHPKHNLKLNIGGIVVEAAVIRFAYTPTDVPRKARDNDKMRSAKQWNNDYHQALLKTRKPWTDVATPAYAVLVKEQEVPFTNARGKTTARWMPTYHNVTVYAWRNDIIVEGQPEHWDFQIVGALTGKTVNDVHQVDETVTIRIEEKPYTGDKFHISEDGHYVSDIDGFVVPKDFMEFYTAYPLYVRRWASKWLHKTDPKDEDVRDWEQELLLYLHYLPETSKARKPSDRHPNGCTDVIQCFDPIRQYGASERRFRNYLNICLHNRSLTMIGRMKKNPAYRKDNLPFSAVTDDEATTFTVDDEYLHAHSEYLTKRSEEIVSTIDKKLLVQSFVQYVKTNEPTLIPTLTAIAETGTLREAMETLGVDEPTFTRDRKRIIALRESFLDAGPIPKQRKPYKKRERSIKNEAHIDTHILTEKV